MKQLIVNADDLGADISRNAGIFEAIEAGMVTSVSILPNGPALEDALLRIRALNSCNLSLGIHFNLSEGTPASPGLKRLAGPDGCFLRKQSAQKLLVLSSDLELKEEIRRELELQISRLLDAGIHLDHVDGHQHIHILPAVSPIAIQVAKSHRIPWVRIPEEHAGQLKNLLPNEVEEALFFCTHAEAARPLYKSAGFMIPDNFRGLYFKGKLPHSLWTEFLEEIPQGITELMVHPGHVPDKFTSEPLSGFSTPDREKELQALIDGRLRQALVKAGVELTQFPPASN
jgi:chitin disaccharide deacetylase